MDKHGKPYPEKVFNGRPEIQKLCQYIEKLEIGVVLLVPAVKPVIVALPLLIKNLTVRHHQWQQTPSLKITGRSLVR
jgi:hypothetical protein